MYFIDDTGEKSIHSMRNAIFSRMDYFCERMKETQDRNQKQEWDKNWDSLSEEWYIKGDRDVNDIATYPWIAIKRTGGKNP